ncbi:hypothetical protein FrEUN1fDRAFT_2777 [Parafrankia sp. EUN1f]|nr:hypothetical protein FrEUN1fDRAFT_2777 [Parafrankia sp. EUN1f]
MLRLRLRPAPGVVEGLPEQLRQRGGVGLALHGGRTGVPTGTIDNRLTVVPTRPRGLVEGWTRRGGSHPWPEGPRKIVAGELLRHSVSASLG